MAATLMEANQNSNSPKDFTEPRLVSVSSDHEDQRPDPLVDAREPSGA